MTSSVVLVHGLRTSKSMWRVQVAALKAAGHQPIAIDLPGHGARISERFTVAGAVDAITAAVDSAAHPVFLCGYSLGGYMSIHWAGLSAVTGSSSITAGANRPITGLLAASCGTQPYRVVLDGWRVGARAIYNFRDKGLSLNNWAVRRAVRDPELANDVIAGGVALEVMDDVLRELRQVHPLRSIRHVEVPVWLVNGSLDHFRLEERRYLAAAPNARLIHVAGATHMVSIVRPAQFTQILLDAVHSVSS